MLGLSRADIMRLVDLGFLKPARGPRQSYLFSFRDVVVLRTAHELKKAELSSRKIMRALNTLKKDLPEEAPLSGLRITAVGNSIAVRDRTSQWEAETGQLLMDFDVRVDAGTVRVLAHAPRLAGRAAAPAPTAQELFQRGEEYEGVDDTQAIRAYKAALKLDPTYTNAYLNLGAILCEQGECADSVELYDEALEHCPAESLLHFNRAVALEDMKLLKEALASYEEAIRLDPKLADGYWNASRIHQKFGNGQVALRYLNAYRRLEREGRGSAVT